MPTKEKHFEEYSALATLPLRDVVVYPHMVLPLFVGRPKSIAALEAAMANDDPVFLLAQIDPNTEDPTASDLHRTGTVAQVLQVLKLPDGTVKVLVEGIRRGRVLTIEESGGLFLSHVEAVDEYADADNPDIEAIRRTLLTQFDQYAKLNKKIPAEIINTINGIDDNSRLVDTIAAHLQLKLEQRQQILETFGIIGRMEFLLAQLESELDIMQVEKRIRGRVKRQMEKSQREYYLNEQVKAIQKELGEEDERGELDALEAKIKEAGMTKEAEEKCLSELKKLKMMPPMSAESTVVRNYIDTLLELPWKKKSRVSKDIAKADLVLNADHYGLEKVKERILEYLAVQKRMDKLKGPILCLVGPPGVGKTSLGESIAKATGRQYVRMALGGVRDESEIRGHRRTYIGSMPGKILQNMAKAGVKNPLFLLDEIDKLGSDFRGDPASALLEVLDPEQNNKFADHYAEVDYDLSDVMFIATSNSLNIPTPLLDRMEIIRLSGYTEDEKINIAMQYLVPKQMKRNGVKEGELVVEESAVRDIIRYYTREAGVRSLDREIAKICRKVVMQITLNEDKKRSSETKKTSKAKPKAVKVNEKNLHDYLGVRRFDYGVAESENRIGQVTGLAWTEVGGELLTVEAVALPGKGVIQCTGQLGDVMKESVSAAWSVVRSRAESVGLAPDFYEKKDIHVHVPEGATPKDGPSAGIAMTLAMVSAFTKIPVRADVAMTGEITLRGEVLPIGGLKEKLLAALRGGIKHVLIPKDNVKDLEEIPENVKTGLTIHPVKWIDEVLALGLESQPTPWVAPLSTEEAQVEAAKPKSRAKATKH
ncbi:MULTISPECIES: endopeptidase La [Neisseria]|jgi:endopeptidase La|uniref:Lon protease n=1 Tax=Neisseria sicca ATCC 29256 TaxID=547045 RepID=C6M338_NEISI|nr:MULTISPECIES: endopeptidase La [Neisseria]MDU1534542.1 endopeptidase La [Neisseria sp.]EET45302.1 endopeptidase La [Neisseria sicca ATCC 29256]EGY60934.1 lon protease [Neisseria sp. GT4A_CT1]OFL97334.1 endopeptidase La [Neisseria sp. HMSC074B07]QMT38653.1 endopeptidase La [Neisseria sicca]